MSATRPFVILLGYTVPEEDMEGLLCADPGMPVQTHRFAWSLVEALTLAGVDVHLVSTLLASNYPRNPVLRVRSSTFAVGGVSGRSVGYLNVVGVKHAARWLGLTRALRSVIARQGRPLAVLVHGTASPLLAAAETACGAPGIPVVPIITDIPNWRFSMGTPPLSWLRRGDNEVTRRLIQSTDGVVALTEALASDFAPALPSLVFEGIAPVGMFDGVAADRPACMDSSWINVSYVGSLHEQYGVGALIQAIDLVRDERVHLHLFGRGNVRADGGLHGRVHFHGVVGRAQVAQVMAHSDVLINPRDPAMEFTRYSFPSKLLEYMLSGTTTLTTRLPSIPREYGEFLEWIDVPTPGGIAAAIEAFLSEPLFDAEVRANRAKEYVRSHCGPAAQGGRIRDFLSKLDEYVQRGNVA